MNKVTDLPVKQRDDLSTKTALVIDNGLFVEIARTISKSFGRVLYYCSWEAAYPKSNRYVIGHGIEGIELIHDIFDYIDQVDIFIFPDIYYGGLQVYLESQGKLVFGGRKGEEMELLRETMKEHMKKLGLFATNYEVVTGLDNLREYLKEHENVWIKQNITRGDFETFYSKNYKLVEPVLDALEHNLGAIKYIKDFIVEDAYDGVETGMDCYCIDGEYPSRTLAGIEVKDCYDKETEVLTDNGWKLFSKLDKNEKILTLNMSDNRHIKYEYQKPTDYIERDYRGNLVYIEKDSVSLCITPTHNVLVNQSYQLENGEELEWTSCTTGNVTKFKRGTTTLKLRPVVELINENKRFSLLQPKGCYISPNPNKNKIKIGDFSISKKDFAEFMGWYLSEGYVSQKKNEVMISQFKYSWELEKCMNKMPFECNKTKRGFYIYYEPLVQYLRQFGKSQDKHVPLWIKESGQDIINAFLNAYCYGDGSFIKNYKSIRKDSRERYGLADDAKKMLISRHFYTSSTFMRDDLQELLIKVGSVAVSYESKQYINNTTGKVQSIYNIHEKLINRKNYIFPQDIQYQEYNDKVYCVTVPNSIIMVRRNGKAMWCGNCGYVGKFVPYDNLSPSITDYNKKMASTMKDFGYRGFFSTEIRVSKDKPPYMVDKCARAGSPPNELYQYMYTNLADIIWYGAKGILIDPIVEHKYGVEAIIHSAWSDTNWLAIHFPKKYRDNIKLYNACCIDGKYYCVPQKLGHIAIGGVVATGDTLEEAIELAKKIAATVEGHEVEIRTESFDKAQEEFNKLAKMGIKIL